jgi:hypothetical protein
MLDVSLRVLVFGALSLIVLIGPHQSGLITHQSVSCCRCVGTLVAGSWLIH